MINTPRNPPSMFAQPEAKGVLRTRYLPGQELSWQDLTTDQDYHILQRRTVNRYGLGFTGILHGLDVTLDDQTAIISPGMAIDGWGREILLVDGATLPLSGLASNQDKSVFYVNIAYYEVTRVFGPPGPGRSYARTVESPHVYWSVEKPLSPLDGVLLATLQRTGSELEVIRSSDNGRTLVGRRILFSDAQTQDSVVGCAITLSSDGRSLLVDGAMSITPLPSVGSSAQATSTPNSTPVFSVKMRSHGDADASDALVVGSTGGLTLAGTVQWNEPNDVTLQIGPRSAASGDPTTLPAPQLSLSAPAIYLDAPVWVNVSGTPTPLADAGYWKWDSDKKVLYYTGDVDVRSATGGSIQLRAAGVSTLTSSLSVLGGAALGTSDLPTGWSLYATSGAWLKGAAGPDKLALSVEGAAHLSADASIDGKLSVNGDSHFTGALTVSGALTLDGANAQSHVAGALSVDGLLSAGGNVQLTDAATLYVSTVESKNEPLTLSSTKGVAITAPARSGTGEATLQLLSEENSDLLAATAGGKTSFRVDQGGRTWSEPRSAGSSVDLRAFASLLGSNADQLRLLPVDLVADFPSYVDGALVDLQGLIAPLVQAVSILAQRIDGQASASSSIGDKLAEMAKLIAALGLR